MDRAAALRSAVGAGGGPHLAAVEWPETLASTSDRLKAWARRGAPEWTVVLADRQTGGRGREGRRWESPPGGLYLSVLLRPRVERIGLLPLAAGVAVADAAAEVGVATELKWPNDVLVGGRKLAGILAESASGAGGIEWVVLGVGLNVSLSPGALPADLRAAVTTLAEEGAVGTSVSGVAAFLLRRLAVACEALGRNPASVVAAWKARSVPWWGDVVEVAAGEGTMHGRLLDVDEDGALVLETDLGVRRRLVSGEVVRVRRVPAARADHPPAP